MTPCCFSLWQCAVGDSLPFTVLVKDPSGNSFVESIGGTQDDPKLSFESYPRSQEEEEVVREDETLNHHEEVVSISPAG